MKVLLRTIITVLIFILVFQTESKSENKFEIVFTTTLWDAEHVNQFDEWLEEIKNNWGATSISFCIFWNVVEPAEGRYNWDRTDYFIQKILDKNLNLYLRIAMGILPEWVTPGNHFSKQDYYIDHTGNIFMQYNRYALNFGSENSLKYMTGFYTSVMEHLKTKYSGKIKKVVPSVNFDLELEFTYAEMCGYSKPEIKKFRSFLRNKYNDINSLNNKWKTNFTSFDKINPKKYNWYLAASPETNYDITNGRVDWINFRTGLLKSFIDRLAKISHSNGFEMALQVGSIYDENIERRGWYDPVSLYQNADFAIVADISEYKPDFSFGADYLRSICTYWSYENNSHAGFGTESNWAGYGNHSASELCIDWTDQLKTYYYKGAAAHFIWGWDISASRMNELSEQYSSWKEVLKEFSGKPVRNVSYSKAVHLSCEQGNFLGNKFRSYPSSDSYYRAFQFFLSIIPEGKYTSNQNNYAGESDIITSYIISRSPDYLSRYQSFSFTKGSNYISNSAYENLSERNTFPEMTNATEYSADGIKKDEISPGNRNEYNEERTSNPLLNKIR